MMPSENIIMLLFLNLIKIEWHFSLVNILFISLIDFITHKIMLNIQQITINLRIESFKLRILRFIVSFVILK